MTYNEASKRATIKYQKEHLKRIPLSVPKDYYENRLKPAAENAGESVNGYIKKSIDMRINSEAQDDASATDPEE